MTKIVSSLLYTRTVPLTRCLSLFAATSFTLIFVALAETVWRNESFTWDQPVIRKVIQFRQPWLDFAMNVITDTGREIAILVTIGVALYFFWRRQRLKAITLLISFAGAMLFNVLLKLLFGPPQTIILANILSETRHSFPSGHAVAATVLYGMLAVFLWRQRHYGWAILASGWIMVVAVSRIYLGAHFPSEVLAGLAFGGLWLFVTFTCFDWYKQYVQHNDKYFSVRQK